MVTYGEKKYTKSVLSATIKSGLHDEGDRTPEDNNKPAIKQTGEMIMGNESIFEKVKTALPELDYEAALKLCMEDEEFYLELFQDYSELPIKEELIKCYKESDYKNYCVHIHGFKNNSYSIGARELGDLAYAMEQLTREEIPDEIADMQKVLFEEYDRICSIYQEIVGK